MKYTNLMKLLSALLCAVLLLSACSDPVEPEDDTVDSSAEAQESTEPETEERDPDPVLENFFENKYTQTVLKDAERLEGELFAESNYGTLTVLKESDIDFLNHRTDTYTVYNSRLEKTVLKAGNTYADGAFDPFNWNDFYINENDMIVDSNGDKRIPEYPERVMDVKLHNVAYDPEILMIEVRRATITPIDEEIVEKNEGDFYTVSVLSEFYDMAGQQIFSLDTTQAGLVNDYLNVNRLGSTIKIYLYGYVVTLNAEDGTLLSVVDPDNEVIRYGYDAETKTHGYYLRGRIKGALGFDTKYIEVYDKETGDSVLHYDLDACDSYTASVLSNGNILLQYNNIVDEDSGMAYDYEKIVRGVENGTWKEVHRFYDLETYIIKVPTGEKELIECDYVFEYLYSRDSFLNLPNVDEQKLAVSENATNIGIATPIKDKRVDPIDEGVVVVNNSGKVIFKMDKIIPEHDLSLETQHFLGYELLSTGDYLVELDTVVEDAVYAIATAKGVVRSYLKEHENLWIAGAYLVLEDGVYDHDRKLVYAFEEQELQREAVIGSKILVSKVVEEERLFFEIVKGEDGELILSEALFDGETVSVASSADDYVILRNGTTGKYTMYNVYMEHVLTTFGEMSVTVRDGKYLVKTLLDSHVLYYTIGQ